MKTKRLYQSPLIRRNEVELEDGFCGSIVQDNPNTGFVETTGHEVKTIDANSGLNIGMNIGSGNDEWANNGWK